MNPILKQYNNSLPFSAQERDIDLLLIELLHTSTDFASQFTARVGLTGASVETVRHSVYREHGETDVLLLVAREGTPVAVMIEDKIGAPMQPDQCARYHLRGKALCANATAHEYRTVLFAPAGYLRTVPESENWDYRISFEEAAGFVAATAFPGWEWKEAVLIGATAKQTRAREADNRSNKAFDAIISPLKNAYRAFLLAQFPFLTATKQEGRDREYYIGAAALPPGIRFKHAFFRGEISLIFERAWAERAERSLTNALPEGTWTVRHGGEFHVRASVEVMDPAAPFDQQEDIAAQALTRIASLIPLAEAVTKIAA